MSRKKRRQPNPNGINVGYIRKSKLVYPENCNTPELKATYETDLLNSRIAELHIDAARHNETIDHIFVDMDISGQDYAAEKRTDMIDLRKMADDGLVRRVWMRDLSRLARDLLFQELFFRDMKQFGVEVYLDGERMKEDDPNTDLQRQMLGAFNQHRAAQDSFTIKKNLAAKVLGSKTIPPTWVGRQRDTWGLVYSTQTKSFTVDERKLPYVIDLFETFVRNYGNIHKTAMELNTRLAEGLPTAYYSSQQRLWCHMKVKRAIQSPLYNRHTSWNGALVYRPDCIPETVEDTLYAEANRLLVSRMRSGAKPPAAAVKYTYSGLLKCQHCGGGLRTANRKTNLDGDRCTYSCRKAYYSRALCPEGYGISSRRLDVLVKRALVEALERVTGGEENKALRASKVTTSGRSQIKVPTAEERLVELQEEEARCRAMYKGGAYGGVENLHLLLADLEDINKRRGAVLASAGGVAPSPKLPPTVNAMEIIDAINTLWDTVETDSCDMRRHQLLVSLGGAFIIHVYSKPPARSIKGSKIRRIAGKAKLTATFSMMGISDADPVEVDEDDATYEKFRPGKRPRLIIR